MKKVRVLSRCHYKPPGSDRVIELFPSAKVIVMDDKDAEVKAKCGTVEYLDGEAPLPKLKPKKVEEKE